MQKPDDLALGSVYEAVGSRHGCFRRLTPELTRHHEVAVGLNELLGLPQLRREKPVGARTGLATPQWYISK